LRPFLLFRSLISSSVIGMDVFFLELMSSGSDKLSLPSPSDTLPPDGRLGLC
jgi:hypothetical protein